MNDPIQLLQGLQIYWEKQATEYHVVSASLEYA